MELQPGATLLHYRIVDKIGEGGMGVVWKAVDTSLGREVAIKVLPASAASDAERLARFEREAKLLASLNHANIAAIHGLHRTGDTHFLAMELVGGEDLAVRLASGPLPLDAALRIARQLAQALGAAHAAGVIHRDLKPVNIRITPSGDVKVLDFGLAKALTSEAPGGATRDPALSPTLTSAGTMAGAILGTAAYMAPEQARGQEVDRRADIWAFGAVFHEMLTGRQLFSGKTVSDTLAAVLTREPDWTAVPARVRGLLRACLSKEPEERLRDIGDAWLLLQDETQVGEETARRHGGMLLVAAIALGALLTAAAFTYLAPAADLPPTLRFFEHPPGGGSFARSPLPSPDGSHLAMLVREPQGTTRLWVRPLDGEAHAIDGTEGIRHVAWSPDSSELAYFVPGELRRVRRDGGGTRLVASSVLGQAVQWSTDGSLYLINFNEILRLSPGGGEPSVVASVPGVSFRGLALLPGSRLLVQQFGEQTGVYVVPVDGGDRYYVLPGVETIAGFLPPDRVLYAEDRVLLVQQVDVERAQAVGELATLAAGVADGAFEVGGPGIITYLQGASLKTNLTWFDRTGNVVSTLGPEAEYREVYLSPRGDRVAYVAADPTNGNRDIWMQDAAGGPPSRLTSSADVDHMVAFSPDGREIVWESHAGTGLLLMRGPVDGSTPAALVTDWNRGGGPADWSPDGRYVLYNSDTGSMRRSLWAVPMNGDGEPVSLIDSEFDDGDGRFSPDGRWAAYSSDATGDSEIYLQRLDGIERVGGPLRVSNGGGTRPRWRGDGRELFYVAGTVLMACDVLPEAERPAGTSRALFDLGERQSYPDYAVAPDGQSFLAVTSAGDDSSSRPATVILNWRPEAQR